MQRLRHVEIAAWMAGLGLLMGYSGFQAWSVYARSEGIAALQQAREEFSTTQREPGSQRVLTAAQPDTSSWARTRLVAYRESIRQPVVPQAVLRIPALALAVPVFDGTGELNLNRGAGRIEGTARIGAGGNMGLAAHRDGYFRALKDIRTGDELYLDTASSTVAYHIVSIRIVDPADVEVLAATPTPTITLVTCYPFYYVGPAPKRFIVRAQKNQWASAAPNPDLRMPGAAR